MTGIFLFSEDTALAMQLLTPALELKRSLDQPIIALALTKASARDLAAGGADTVLLLQGAGDWVEELGEAIHGLVKARGGSVLLVGATLRGKQVADWVAARLSGPVLSPAGRHGAVRLCRLPGVRCLPHPVQRRRRDTLELSGGQLRRQLSLRLGSARMAGAFDPSGHWWCRPASFHRKVPMITTRSIRTAPGLEFEVSVAGPADGPLVLMLHGFGVSRFLWTAQVEALGAAGYLAAAPNQRGYAAGARPDPADHASYRIGICLLTC